MNAKGYLFAATHPLALKSLLVRGSHLNYPFHLEQGSSQTFFAPPWLGSYNMASPEVCQTFFQICGAVGNFEQCC
jgi:hypothetical protein